MAAAAAEGAVVTVESEWAADSKGESREVEGGVGASAEEDPATKAAEAAGDSEEDREDLFEVERILDMKTDAGRILYKVHWKGYTSGDDTWDPEIHLEDCKEVLEFRKKVAENEAKAVKKDIQKLSLNNDIFEANSDSVKQSEAKEDTSPRKKKKKLRQKEEKSPDDLKKKKAKTGKLKDKSKSELDSSSEKEKQKFKSPKDKIGEDAVQEKLSDRHLDDTGSADEGADSKTKRKKKKLRKSEEPKEGTKLENENAFSEKKTLPKKQRNQDRGRKNTESDKLLPPTSDNHRRVPEDQKTKENKYSCKGRRATRDETDTWVHIATEDEQESLDIVCPADESLDGRQQILSLGMDLQLEWMKLEDFQRHLDGEDETFATADAIPSHLLRDAVKNGDYISVKVALNSNEEYNSSGMTLVMLAAAGGQDDFLRLLITKGAKVNGWQNNGTTVLIHAAEKNFLTTVAILLEAGAFVNVQQSNGETALMKACKRGNSDIVWLVIECGANCNILSKH
ncbi:M-phase phosphoprotein 8 [Heterocephalus glaber]|uniref:M-phase phosphoprotein 8 n=1 Tax=Heterocephalus glaber TaxID=10181 RepID=G5AV59_HETGA|nr:M-phase phosphoprotein 8 [Heterocephalus glaber]